MNIQHHNYPSLEYENATKILLLQKVEKANSLAEIRKHFKEFAKKYTVIPRLWEIWLQKELTVTYKDYSESQKLKQLKKVKNLAKMHFYHAMFLEYNFQSFTQGKFGRAFFWETTNIIDLTRRKRVEITFDPFSTELLFQLFNFPHDKLMEYYQFLKKYSTYPIPPKIQQKYKDSQKLFHQITAYGRKSVESEMLLENRTETFVIAAIEYLQQKTIDKKMIIIENYESAIGMLPICKRLWKMYINYLKCQKEDKKLLNLYSRFCRLFITDKKVQKEYQTELEKQSKAKKRVGKWWIDKIEFEKDFIGTDSARILLNQALAYCIEENLVKYGIFFEKKYGTMQQYMEKYSNGIKIYPNLINLNNFSKQQIPLIKTKIEFNYKNDNFKLIDSPKFCTPRILEAEKRQNFSFFDGIISYIEKFAYSSTLLKLQMSAKFFYFQSKSLLCHNFTVLNGQNYGPIFFPNSLFINSNYSDFPILKNFTVTNALIIHSENAPQTFSTLLPKLNLNIFHLILTNQNLNFPEFELLTNLKLKSVSFDKVIIKKSDGIFMAVDEIISMFIIVKDFCILNGIFTAETSKNFTKLKRSKKIKIFEISEINQSFFVDDFIEFSKENLRSSAKITVHFFEVFTEEERKEFTEILKDSLPEASVTMFDEN